MNEIDRKVKNFMEMIQMVCPGCNEAIMHNQIVKHMAGCEEAKALAAKGREFDTVNDVDAKLAMQETAAN